MENKASIKIIQQHQNPNEHIYDELMVMNGLAIVRQNSSSVEVMCLSRGSLDETNT